MSISAQDYDNLQITAQEHDSLGLTINDFQSITLDKIKELIIIRTVVFNSIKDDTPMSDEAVELINKWADEYPVAKQSLSVNPPIIKKHITTFIGAIVTANMVVDSFQKSIDLCKKIGDLISNLLN